MESKVFNIDCMKGLKDYPDGYFDLAILDPVYGIDGNSHRKNKSRGKCTGSKDYHAALWKQRPPTKRYFKEVMRVSKHQIIFGINYFTKAVPNIGGGRIIWDKVNGQTTFSDGEIAYCSKIESVRIFRFMWNGMMQGSSINEGWVMQGDKSLNEFRIHPTQKPVRLYKWLLTNYAQKGDKILDTHLGSGSSRIACYDLGFEFTGFEIEKKYYQDQEQRFKTHISQIPIPFK